ncbi:pilus assembly PilX N-terminal domain-containing protein [Anoxynatronum sibiricum]|uniref:Pilus assembly PilX N-terminal domain-containing protein n=1 Tax=Anoxynatronum sibiricum TaxID=210623 RepID=A0ABU9VQ32_9CLOT
MKIKPCNKGFTLVWVIVVMLVLSILGVALLSVSLAETRHTMRSEHHIQVDYIARSGVEAGYQKLLGISPRSSVSELVSAANNLGPSNLQSIPFGNGTYSIDYIFNPDQSALITIRSEAQHVSAPLSSVVTLQVPTNVIFNTTPWTEPPNSWWRASNLWDSINPDVDGTVDMTSRAVAFSGSPTKSPQNGRNLSIFRANVILFRGTNNSGVTFQQQKNTNDITFDAEILLFEGSVRLRDANKKITFDLSNTMLAGSINPWTYAGQVGFEDEGRYNAFISGVYDDYAEYNFGEAVANDVKFGLVYFEDAVVKDGVGTVISPDYYYFAQNTNINKSSVVIRDAYEPGVELIRVRSDDPIKQGLADRQSIRTYRAGTEKMIYSAE